LRVPSGAEVRIEGAHVSTERFWPPPDGWPLHEGDAPTLARRLIEELEASVARALPESGVVGVHASGGLDSSTILILARRIARDRPGLEIVPIAHVHPGLECDESKYIAELVHDEASAIVLPGGPMDPALVAASCDRSRLMPGGATDVAAEPIIKEAIRRGIQVILTGHGGDHLFGGTQRGGAVALAQGRPDKAWRFHAPATPRTRLARIVRYDVPALRNHVSPWRSDPPLFTRSMIDEVDRASASSRSPLRRAASISARLRWPVIEHFGAFFPEDRAAMMEGRGIEFRHPFMDPAFVAFAVAVPEHIRAKSNDFRFLHRMAIEGLVPAPIAMRRDKASFRSLTELFIAAMFNDLESRPWRIVERGLLRRGELQTIGSPQVPDIAVLARVVRAEYWLRRRDA
jgi:asparagine synthase (glutamine-hydrolysing)